MNNHVLSTALYLASQSDDNQELRRLLVEALDHDQLVDLDRVLEGSVQALSRVADVLHEELADRWFRS